MFYFPDKNSNEHCICASLPIPQIYPHLGPQNLWMGPYLEKRIFVHVIKELKMGLSWITGVYSKSNFKCPQESEEEEK